MSGLFWFEVAVILILIGFIIACLCLPGRYRFPKMAPSPRNKTRFVFDAILSKSVQQGKIQQLTFTTFSHNYPSKNPVKGCYEVQLVQTNRDWYNEDNLN